MIKEEFSKVSLRRLVQSFVPNYLIITLLIGEALIRRMVRMGLLSEQERKLDYVLGLTVA